MKPWEIRLKARKRAGLTQLQVGALFDPPVSRVATSFWEKPESRGGTHPDGKKLVVLTRAYGLTAGQLLGLEPIDWNQSSELFTKKMHPAHAVGETMADYRMTADPLETQLIAAFRQLSPEGREKVLMTAISQHSVEHPGTLLDRLRAAGAIHLEETEEKNAESHGHQRASGARHRKGT